jgi:hypothetical protein
MERILGGESSEEIVRDIKNIKNRKERNFKVGELEKVLPGTKVALEKYGVLGTIFRPINSMFHGDWQSLAYTGISEGLLAIPLSLMELGLNPLEFPLLVGAHVSASFYAGGVLGRKHHERKLLKKARGLDGMLEQAEVLERREEPKELEGYVTLQYNVNPDTDSLEVFADREIENPNLEKGVQQLRGFLEQHFETGDLSGTGKNFYLGTKEQLPKIIKKCKRLGISIENLREEPNQLEREVGDGTDDKLSFYDQISIFNLSAGFGGLAGAACGLGATYIFQNLDAAPIIAGGSTVFGVFGTYLGLNKYLTNQALNKKRKEAGSPIERGLLGKLWSFQKLRREVKNWKGTVRDVEEFQLTSDELHPLLSDLGYEQSILRTYFKEDSVIFINRKVLSEDVLSLISYAKDVSKANDSSEEVLSKISELRKDEIEAVAQSQRISGGEEE